MLAVAATRVALAQEYDVEELDRKIAALAANSDLARYDWRQRGRAPIGYIKGMAVAYGRVYQEWKDGTLPTTLMAMANTHLPGKDALSWIAGTFDDRDMPIDKPGADTLRALFVLLTGLGMRESSGRFCEGRDRSARNTSSDTAEAGLFQMSWDAHIASRDIVNLFDKYSSEDSDLVHIFHEGVRCSEEDLQNYGSGNGRAFQEACKANPMCAIMTTAVGLRVIRSHWGPVNRREVEIRPEADALFKQVETMVDGESMVAEVSPF